MYATNWKLWSALSFCLSLATTGTTFGQELAPSPRLVEIAQAPRAKESPSARADLGKWPKAPDAPFQTSEKFVFSLPTTPAPMMSIFIPCKKSPLRQLAPDQPRIAVAMTVQESCRVGEEANFNIKLPTPAQVRRIGCISKLGYPLDCFIRPVR
jgi:hypothetical protein